MNANLVVYMHIRFLEIDLKIDVILPPMKALWADIHVVTHRTYVHHHFLLGHNEKAIIGYWATIIFIILTFGDLRLNLSFDLHFWESLNGQHSFWDDRCIEHTSPTFPPLPHPL